MTTSCDMAESRRWTMTSPLTSHDGCYGTPTTPTHHGARNFHFRDDEAAAGSRVAAAAQYAYVTDDRRLFPVVSSRDQYYRPSLLQQQQQFCGHRHQLRHHQQLDWFSIGNVVPFTVQTTTSATATSGTASYLEAQDDVDAPGDRSSILMNSTPVWKWPMLCSIALTGVSKCKKDAFSRHYNSIQSAHIPSP